jgi:hypothetical protein
MGHTIIDSHPSGLIFLTHDCQWHGTVRNVSRLKSLMPFKRVLALQIIPLWKQPFKTQPSVENEDVTWSPQYNMATTRTNKCRALSLQEMQLDGWFLIRHIVLETCTIEFMHKFKVTFYILELTSWIWTSPSTERLKFERHSKWNSYESFNLEHWRLGRSAWEIWTIWALGIFDVTQSSGFISTKITNPHGGLWNYHYIC